MIVEEIIGRLRELAMPPFALVDGAAALAALVDQPLAVPAAYVFIKEEVSADNERMMGVLQRTEVDIAVVIIAGNVSDAIGAAGASDLEPLKAAMRAHLVGWQPPSAADAITHIGGQLIRNRAGRVWWEMTLGTAFYIEGED
ncbi:MAG: hypothetical protein J0I31_19255 [Rhizobiales bacterium]|nr:hypothetical protein [Hyphomicrobiales bacterium]